MSKASPQLNPFSVGFLITIVLAFAIIYITLPTLVPYFEKIMTAIFQLIQDILAHSAAQQNLTYTDLFFNMNIADTMASNS